MLAGTKMIDGKVYKTWTAFGLQALFRVEVKATEGFNPILS